MPNSTYFPSRHGDLDSWEENFINKISNVAATLNLTAAEVAAMQAKLEAHRTALSTMITSKTDYAAAVAANETAKKEMMAFMSQEIARIKINNNYTNEIGKDLGIIRSESADKTSESKPKLDVMMEAGKITIKFKKQGMSGVKIYSKRGTENEFIFLAVDTASPYHDTRANLIAGQPEKREYLAYFLDKDDEVGQPSSIETITA
jgi:hypothetical protein